MYEYLEKVYNTKIFINSDLSQIGLKIVIPSQTCDGIINPSQICYGIIIPSQFCDRFLTDL